jgi:hypothetical protein
MNVVQVNLLVPKHPGERLPLDPPFVFSGGWRVDGGIELIGFGAAGDDGFVHIGERLPQLPVREPEPDDDRPPSRNGQVGVMKARFRSDLFRVDAGLSVDDETVEGILHERAAAARLYAEDALRMGLIVGEEQLRARLTAKVSFAQLICKGQVPDRPCIGVVS